MTRSLWAAIVVAVVCLVGATNARSAPRAIGAYAQAPASNPITVTGATLAATAGSAVSGPVATFTDSVSGTPTSAFTVTIDWGDGASTSGTVDVFENGYSASGTHTYAAAGAWSVVVTVADNSGDSAQATSTALISGAPQVGAGTPAVQSANAATLSGPVGPEGATTTAYYQYGLDLRYTRVGASGPTYTSATPSQRLNGDFSSHQVVAALGGLLPNAVYHVRLVATNDNGTTHGPDQTFTTKADPPPGPPVLGKSVDIKPVSGLIFIHTPSGYRPHASFGTAAAKAPAYGSGFVPLTQALQLPAATQVDALQGTLALTTATAQPNKDQTGTFSGAVFKLSQQTRGPNKALETLSLVEGAFKGAPSYASCRAHKALAGPIAGVAALSPNVLQTLHARDRHGSFRTRGLLAAGTVRGTVWDTSERCDGTYTVVHQGTVDVYVYATRKTIAVHAGRHYLAPYGKHHP